MFATLRNSRRNVLRLALAATVGIGLPIAVRATVGSYAAVCANAPCRYLNGGRVGPIRPNLAQAEADARAHNDRTGHTAAGIDWPPPF